MKLTSLARVMTGTFAVALLSASIATAATIRTPGNMGQTRFQPTHVGSVQHDFSCPGTYYACGTPPFTATWCVSTSGNCSSGLVGVWTWSAVVAKIKTGKPTSKVTATWSPNPGNPSTVTFAKKNGKNGKGKKLAYTGTLSTCSSTYGCFTNFAVYGISN